MDKNGFFTLSASVVYEKDVCDAAKRVVLEVNPNAPRTHGDTQIHVSEVDYIVEVDYPLPETTTITCQRRLPLPLPKKKLSLPKTYHS